MSDTSRTPITEEESYALKYAKYIADETTDFTAYRVIKAVREATRNDSWKLVKAYGLPQATGMYFGLNMYIEPAHSKVFIEIDFGTDVEIEKTINLDKVWENLLYEYKQDYRKEIIANLDLGAITWDYGEEAGEDPYCSSVDFDGGEGANRTGQTGEAPDFQYEYYFWRKDTPPASFDELERNRTEYLRWNETHMWPEVTLRNLNKDKQVDSRPYISLWAIGYWKSLSGRYEILEDRTILDELMMNVYSKDGEAVARQKYNIIRFGLEDIIDQYHMRGDDFDRNNIPDAYRAYESLLNNTFGTSFNFIETAYQSFYRITNGEEL